MDQRKSQHYNYTHESIPIVWHKQTDDFLKYLDRDGKKFLEFYWKHLVDNLGVQVKSSFEGMAYEIEEIKNRSGKIVTVIKMTLPQPVNKGEVYFMALIKFPKNRTVFDIFMTHLPTTAVYTLEWEGMDKAGSLLTGFYELTPHARNVRIRTGCAPEMVDFMNMVRNQIKLPLVEETK